MTLSTIPADRQRPDPYVLRPRQQEAVDKGVEWLKYGPKHKNAIIVLPTGYGKSLVAANIIRELDGPCILSQPSQEILDQNLQKLRAYGFEPAVFSASKRRHEVGQITLVTMGSIWKQPDLFKDFKYWIPDECHRLNPDKGIYESFLSQLPHLRLLGLTATPIRLATNSEGAILRWLPRMVPRIFNETIYYVQLADAFREGHLAKLEYWPIRSIDKSKLKLNTTGAEYDDKSVQRHLFEVHFIDKVVKAVLRAVARGRKHILVFNQSIDDCQYVVDHVRRANVTAEVVCSDPKVTSTKARKYIGEKFKGGDVRVVTNVGVYSTGFDFPALDTVILARPTNSLTLAYQMEGRVVRIDPSKETGWIVDMVGILERFGKLEDLTIQNEGGRKFYFASGNRPLTNVYFGEASARTKYFANRFKKQKQEAGEYV